MVPNNLTEDEEFLANECVPVLLNALRKLSNETSKLDLKCFLELFQLIFMKTKIDIDDPTGELADQLTEKYLGTAEMGNFTSMIPGLTDVNTNFKFV